jgi:hypothetical protein
MTTPPDPDDDIPDFLVENFETERPMRLRAIAAYEDNREQRSGVPQYVRNAFAVQDDAVAGAVAEYAGDLADFLESEGYDTLEEVPEPEEEPPGDTMGSAFYNPGRSKQDDDDDDDGGFLGLFGDD